MIRNCPVLVGGCVAFLFSLLRLSGDPTPAGAPGHALPAGVSETEGREITEALQSLRMKMRRLDPAESPGSPASRTDLLADVALYEKSVTWALKYEPALDAPAMQMIRRSLRQGHLRADALLGGQTPWTTEKGRILRGFRSDVDGSTQPYGVVVPAGYDSSKPMRLDVVLHGSLSRWAGSAELRFETWFKPNEAGGAAKVGLMRMGGVKTCNTPKDIKSRSLGATCFHPIDGTFDSAGFLSTFWAVSRGGYYA